MCNLQLRISYVFLLEFFSFASFFFDWEHTQVGHAGQIIGALMQNGVEIQNYGTIGA